MTGSETNITPSQVQNSQHVLGTGLIGVAGAARRRLSQEVTKGLKESREDPRDASKALPPTVAIALRQSHSREQKGESCQKIGILPDA